MFLFVYIVCIYIIFFIRLQLISHLYLWIMHWRKSDINVFINDILIDSIDSKFQQRYKVQYV